MAHEITVNIEKANQDLIISGYPDGIAVTTENTSPYILTEPNNDISLFNNPGDNAVNVNTYNTSNTSSLGLSPCLNILLIIL